MSAIVHSGGVSASTAFAVAIVEGMSDAAAFLDTELRAVHYNRLFVELSGERRARLRRLLRSRSILKLDIFSDTASADARRAMQLRKPIHLTELPVRNAAGDHYTMLQSFLPVCTANDCDGVIVTFRDLTPEARMQAVYKNMLQQEKARAEELARRVAQRTSELALALEQVTRLARTDPLTGLANRRAFAECAERAIKSALRHRRTVAVLMLDLDYFKVVNDRYGHKAGDAVLKEVANTLAGCVRGTDIVARLGGEEFAALLSETSERGAAAVAERCVQAVREIPMARIVPERKLRQTISVGVALCPETAESLDKLLSCADKALYRAKQVGRDRAEVFDERLDHASECVSRPTGPSAIRALIVDPEDERRNARRMQLARRYEVIGAASSSEALSWCERVSFDVILAEEDLGNVDGAEFMRQTIDLLPHALRLLVIDRADVYFAIKGANSGRVDRFLLRSEVEANLENATEEALLRSQLRRDQVAKKQRFLGGVSKAQVKELEQILRGGEVRYAFQPLVSATDPAVVLGHEALCRPPGGAFPGPAELFEAALHLGSIWDLGRLCRCVIADHAQQLSQLVFVNLHPAEIGDHVLLGGEDVLCPLAHRIVFEITEHAAFTDIIRFKNRLKKLRSLGFRLAVDDLGSGYASLNLMAVVAPDFVKLDRELVNDISTSSTKRSLIKSVINFANQEGIRVVAEGIESQLQQDALLDLGVHMLQGYWIGRPQFLAETGAREDSG